MIDINKENKLILVKPSKIPEVWKELIGKPLTTPQIQGAQGIFEKHGLDFPSKVELDRRLRHELQEIHERYHGLVQREDVRWTIDLHEIINLTRSGEIIITFTGALKHWFDRPTELPDYVNYGVIDHLPRDEFNNCIVAAFAMLLDSDDQNKISNQFVRLDTKPFRKRMSRLWARYILDMPEQTSEILPINTPDQEQAVKKYYSYDELITWLRDHVANDELVDIQKFIDAHTATWSRQLVVTPHNSNSGIKKVTIDTPRYSLIFGPKILVIHLERGDLEMGERAVALRMIFAHDETGVSLAARVAGGMVTSQNVDIFSQITRELIAGETVHFITLDQIVSYVSEVAIDQQEANAFRNALKNPEEALREAGDTSRVYFAMFKDKSTYVVETLASNPNESRAPVILNKIVLSNMGGEDGLRLGVAARDEVAELHTSPAYKERVWPEVRARELHRPEDAVSGPTEPSTIAGYTDPIKPVKITGLDRYLLAMFLDRLHAEPLAGRDRAALRAFKDHVLGGDVLANIDQWSYKAVVLDRAENEQSLEEDYQFLFGENNVFIIIFNDALPDGMSDIMTFQCKVQL